jgi:tetratricopeptide (TPR) repeat protein
MNAQQANSAGDTADAVSNAVVTPESSLFIREILEKALTNPVGVAPRWAADAWALLANVLLNDYLNWWNYAGSEELRKADDAAQNALALDPKLPFAHHAVGLIHRTRRNHNAARKAFKKAKYLDPGFARGHAQFGNQKSFLGRLDEVQDPLDKAISLNPRHPASGYFYWGKGRAYFEEAVGSTGPHPDWSNAIKWLTDSVKALQTVWYNRCYLAAAQDASGNAAAAQRTVQDFINDQRFDQATFTRIKQLKPDPKDPARKRVLDFVQPRLP